MFPRDQNEEPFHSRGGIAQAMELQRRKMCEEINRLPESQLKSVEVNQLAEDIATKFDITIPLLDESSVKPSTREVEINSYNDPWSRSNYTGRGGIQTGTEISIFVSFTGDAEVFRLHASTHMMDYPRGTIEGSAIVFRRRGTNLDAAQVRRDFDEWLASIKRHLGGMAQELGDFNDKLVGEALTAFNTRAQKLQRDDELLSGLGFGSPR